jgi:addiction module HigA family antidote
MEKPKEPNHVGRHLREQVVPAGMSVTSAAELLGVGRPALSNLLNGRSALSTNMATRLERAFGVNAEELLELQARLNAAGAIEGDAASSARSYVPPFLEFRAKQIEDWADSGIAARYRLAVLLRTLVHSTGQRLLEVDFPANDDAERPGSDGIVRSDEATPWIPLGESRWEFGVNKRVSQKAQKDYAKSIDDSSIDHRNCTFVFVTPRSWPSKTKWRDARRGEQRWRDVRVYDSSDLEQWIEQSISTQVWLANELGDATTGAWSLDERWRMWSADCDPPLTPELFDEQVTATRSDLVTKLESGSKQPVLVSADSRDEALAFLSCVLTAENPQLARLRDRTVVFTDGGRRNQLALQHSSIIPVVANPNVEREFAGLFANRPSIVVCPSNARGLDIDVSLKPIGSAAFDRALTAMGCTYDYAAQLRRETGRSPTVLRRRLSSLPSIRTPDWAADPACSESLIPFALAGAWKGDCASDQVVLSLLAGEYDYQAIERTLRRLTELNDSPVWAIGSLRGVVSQLDALFAIHHLITERDLQNFFEVAHIVLSEDDPSLDLPEDERWYGPIAGKVREVSGAIRDGIRESLLLLSTYGDDIFRDRIGASCADRASELVVEILSPLTLRALEANHDNLPTYAEAAPEQFLRILEADLRSNEPQSLKLMRPVQHTFGRCPRTGILWALETLAWDPEYLGRTVEVLAQLAKPNIDDNWVHKPRETLRSIFRSWSPQTHASTKQRIAAFDHLVAQHPKVAWPICLEQFDNRARAGRTTRQPQGDSKSSSATRVDEDGDSIEFAIYAVDAALNWSFHDLDTLGDLVMRLEGMEKEQRDRVWSMIEGWAANVSNEDKSHMREKIRMSTFRWKRRGMRDDQHRVNEIAAEGVRVQDALQLDDLVWKHAWLFENRWVHESIDEFENSEITYIEREERVTQKRLIAIRSVYSEQGLTGAVALASLGDAADIVGSLLAEVLTEDLVRISTIQELLSDDDSETNRSTIEELLRGFLRASGTDAVHKLVMSLSSPDRPKDISRLLQLAPFEVSTWKLASQQGAAADRAYWSSVANTWIASDSTETWDHAIEKLLEVGRPKAAFRMVAMHLDRPNPIYLHRILKNIAEGVDVSEDPYSLDSYQVAEAIEILSNSGDIAPDEMAFIEYAYLEFLDDRGSNIPNLRREMWERPDMFVRMLVSTFRRSDDGQDPEEYRWPNTEIAEMHARKGSVFLDRVSIVPHEADHGAIDVDRLGAWLAEVRRRNRLLGREKTGDFVLGKILARAPLGSDGVWPHESVRHTVDEFATPDVIRGITNELFNSRGVYSAGDNGDGERKLAAKYAAWSGALEYKFPRLSAAMREMERTYVSHAAREDVEGAIRQRLVR